MLHKNIAAGDVHVPYNWSYANAAARTGATGFVAGDVGTLARQTDDNSLWMLTATTPTWVQVGGSGASITAKDEGATLTSTMTSIDFVGAGVTATNTGGAVTVTIAGGGGAVDPRDLILAGLMFGRRM